MSATKEKEPKEQRPAVYKMPYAELGMDVWWYPDGDPHQPPHVGKITAVYHDSVCVNVSSPTAYNFFIREGVRHVSDPRFKQAERKESGGWDHTPLVAKLLNLIDDFTEFMLNQPIK